MASRWTSGRAVRLVCRARWAAPTSTAPDPHLAAPNWEHPPTQTRITNTTLAAAEKPTTPLPAPCSAEQSGEGAASARMVDGYWRGGGCVDHPGRAASLPGASPPQSGQWRGLFSGLPCEVGWGGRGAVYAILQT